MSLALGYWLVPGAESCYACSWKLTRSLSFGFSFSVMLVFLRLSFSFSLGPGIQFSLLACLPNFVEYKFEKFDNQQDSSKKVAWKDEDFNFFYFDNLHPECHGRGSKNTIIFMGSSHNKKSSFRSWAKIGETKVPRKFSYNPTTIDFLFGSPWWYSSKTHGYTR